MAEATAAAGGPAPGFLAQTGVRRLDAAATRIARDAEGILTCTLADGTAYRGVFGVLMFPIRHPEEFVSLRYTDEGDKDHEIGLIVDLRAFPEEARALVRQSLARQTYERIVRRVFAVRYKHSLLFFDVETPTGRHGFVMWWRHDRAQDYGRQGKVLLDVFENRYVIPDVAALPAADRRAFQAFIYW